jgi:hypothetical protein
LLRALRSRRPWQALERWQRPAMLARWGDLAVPARRASDAAALVRGLAPSAEPWSRIALILAGAPHEGPGQVGSGDGWGQVHNYEHSYAQAMGTGHLARTTTLRDYLADVRAHGAAADDDPPLLFEPLQVMMSSYHIISSCLSSSQLVSSHLISPWPCCSCPARAAGTTPRCSRSSTTRRAPLARPLRCVNYDLCIVAATNTFGFFASSAGQPAAGQPLATPHSGRSGGGAG